MIYEIQAKTSNCISVCSSIYFFARNKVSVASCGRVKFTFRDDPLQNAFRGTLPYEVNFTGSDYPCQKYLRGWSGVAVKFTFRDNPLQNTLNISKEMLGVSDYCVFL